MEWKYEEDLFLIENHLLGVGSNRFEDIHHKPKVDCLARITYLQLEHQRNESNENYVDSAKSVGIRLFCPTKRIGAFIGRGGHKISAIRKMSGASVQISQKNFINISSFERLGEDNSSALLAAARASFPFIVEYSSATTASVKIVASRSTIIDPFYLYDIKNRTGVTVIVDEQTNKIVLELSGSRNTIESAFSAVLSKLRRKSFRNIP